MQTLEEKLKEEAEKVDELKAQWEEANSLTEDLERERNSFKLELSEKAVELESITYERDSYHKQAMEHERELRELQRSREADSAQPSLSGSPVRTQPLTEQKSAATVAKFPVSIARYVTNSISGN